jgi:hypothetical protein
VTRCDAILDSNLEAIEGISRLFESLHRGTRPLLAAGRLRIIPNGD